MHHLLAPGIFEQVRQLAAGGNHTPAEECGLALVVGPQSMAVDIIADRMELLVAGSCDGIVLFQSGMFGLTASPQKFRHHAALAEMLPSIGSTLSAGVFNA